MKAKFHHRRFEMEEEALSDPNFVAAVIHARPLGQIPDTTPKATAVTICHLEDTSHNRLATGYSFCSNSDQFSKKRGRTISEGRARKQLRKTQ